MQESDKNFIKNSRTRLIELIEEYYACNEQDSDLKFNEFKTYYKFLLANETISNNNKILYVQEIIEHSRVHLKKWIINFLTEAILKIYKNKIDSSLLINNEYFMFKFLANKEIIKEKIKKIHLISDFNLHYINNIIFFLKEAKTLFNEQSIIAEKIKSNIKKINDIFEVQNFKYRKTLNLMAFTDFVYLKNLLIEYKFIDLINNKYLFEKIDNKIIINDSFKDFLNLIFNIEIDENKILILETNDSEIISYELDKVFHNFA